MTFNYNSMIMPKSAAEFRVQIGLSARVSLSTTIAVIYALSAMAFALFLCRLATRLIALRKLHLDDAFLVLAVSCLIGCVVIISQCTFVFYLANAKIQYPELTTVTFHLFTAAENETYTNMITRHKVIRNVLAVLSWTTIYAVKMCFFTFMYPMIRHLRHLRAYWWGSVGTTLVVWLFSAFKTFMLPEENASSKIVWVTTMMCAMDIITDIVVCSIPIFLLWNVKIKLRTKISVIALLSLSAFMIVCSVIRVAGFIGPNGHTPDATWRMLWTQIECCVAIIMSSLTAVRTLFVAAKTRGEREWKWDSHRLRFIRRNVPVSSSSSSRTTPRQTPVASPTHVVSENTSRTIDSELERVDTDQGWDSEAGFGDPKRVGECPGVELRAY